MWCFFMDHLCYLCLAFVVRVCLLMPCGHLLGEGWPLGSRLWCLIVKLSLSHWYPGSGVVFDCIDSWSLPSFLLLDRGVACSGLARGTVLRPWTIHIIFFLVLIQPRQKGNHTYVTEKGSTGEKKISPQTQPLLKWCLKWVYFTQWSYCPCSDYAGKSDEILIVFLTFLPTNDCNYLWCVVSFNMTIQAPNCCKSPRYITHPFPMKQ